MIVLTCQILYSFVQKFYSCLVLFFENSMMPDFIIQIRVFEFIWWGVSLSIFLLVFLSRWNNWRLLLIFIVSFWLYCFIWLLKYGLFLLLFVDSWFFFNFLMFYFCIDFLIYFVFLFIMLCKAGNLSNPIYILSQICPMLQPILPNSFLQFYHLFLVFWLHYKLRNQLIDLFHIRVHW